MSIGQLTILFQGSPNSVVYIDAFSKTSLPVVVLCNDFNPKGSSVMHRLDSTPRMKMDCWAVSDVSLLSSTARDYAIKTFPFVINCS